MSEPYKQWKNRTLQDVRQQCYAHIAKKLRQGIQVSPQWLLIALTKLIEHEGGDCMPLRCSRKNKTDKTNELEFKDAH